MRFTIALALLAVLGVSSKEMTVRFVTWNVEQYNNKLPSNINQVLCGNTMFDMVFLAIQGVKSDKLYKEWEKGVKKALKKNNSQLYTSEYHKNVAHFIGYHKQYDSKFSTRRIIDYTPFEDSKDTSMMAVVFAWHRQNFTVIHGRVPTADDESTKSSYYNSLKKTIIKNGPYDFFFIVGDLSYLSDMLSKNCWNVAGSDSTLAENFLSNVTIPNSSSKVMYKSHSIVKLVSYDLLSHFDSKPLRVEYLIDIDTSREPLKKYPSDSLT